MTAENPMERKDISNLFGFGEGFWLMAKEWVDVQRQGKLAAMSRKLAAGSLQSQRREVRERKARSRRFQITWGLLTLTLLAGVYDLSRPTQSLLLRAASESVLDQAQAIFPSLQVHSGPGTAESLGGLPVTHKLPPASVRMGTNGLQE